MSKEHLITTLFVLIVVFGLGVAIYAFNQNILIQKAAEDYAMTSIAQRPATGGGGGSGKTTAKPVITNIATTNITESSVTITWVTDQPATTQVLYGPTTAYGSYSPLDSTLTTNHSVALTGLSPKTTYHYVVQSRFLQGSTLTTSPDQSFNTLASIAVVNPPAPTGGTGSTVTGPCDPTDRSGCGNVGDPYATEGGAPDANATHLTSCDTNLQANTSYILDNDVTAVGGNSASCFNIQNGMKLDLGGHTVNGRIGPTYNPLNNTHIFHGYVFCSSPDIAGACIAFVSSPAPNPSTPAVLHHLTVKNVITNRGASNIFIELDPNGLSGTNFKIYNITANTPTCTDISACSRWPNVRVNSRVIIADFSNNSFTCAADTNACQGIEMWGSPSRIHNNSFVMQPVISSSMETGRAMLFDAGFDTPGYSAEADHNYIIANSNRAIRVRRSPNVHIHDNYIANCTGPACIHLYDPDGGIVEDYGNLLIENNTFEMNGGIAVFGRWGTGALIKNNTVVAAGSNPLSGTFGSVSVYATGSTTMTFCNNPAVGNPNILTTTNGTGVTTANIYNSGNGGGSGTVNILTSCPG